MWIEKSLGRKIQCVIPEGLHNTIESDAGRKENVNLSFRVNAFVREKNSVRIFCYAIGMDEAKSGFPCSATHKMWPEIKFFGNIVNDISLVHRCQRRSRYVFYPAWRFALSDITFLDEQQIGGAQTIRQLPSAGSRRFYFTLLRH